jgi:hypothetical protein
VAKQFGSRHADRILHGTQNRVQCSQAKGIMIRNRDAMVIWPVALDDDVAADLVDLVITE